MRTDLVTDPGTSRRRGVGFNRLSTAQTLSLVTAGIVLVVLAIVLVVVRHELTQSAIESEQDRLDRSVRQLATVSASNMRATRLRYSAVVQDTAIVSSLRAGGGSPAAVSALARLGAATDSGLPIELWSANGRRLSFVGDDYKNTVELQVPTEAAQAAPTMRPGLDSVRVVDSLQVGMLVRRDDNRTGLWLAMPVIVDSNVLGFILQARRVARNPQTEQTIRELSGNSATGFYHNIDGSTWTTFGGEPVDSPSAADSNRTRIRRGVGQVMYAETRVPGTQLVMTMEVPRAVVVARPQGVVGRLAAYGIALTILAALIALVVGRLVMRPLTGLTTAAEDLASGDYSRRVACAGTVDVARLAGAFNFMATQVGEARKTLEGARETAEAASRAKTDFLAAMSHELRTPLNAIGGYTELMEMGLRGPVSDDQRRDLARIRTNQQHLLGLIGSVLDLNRIESGRVTFERTPIAVDAVMTGLEALIAPQADARQQRLTLRSAELGLVVIGDREKLRQVMLNLLSNAIRHSPPGSAISVSANRRDSRIEISVADDGPGIHETHHEAIFEPFVQVGRSLKNPTEGVGLGLAISRDLSRGMGGDLTVRSIAGKGATFTLTLPAGTLDDSTDLRFTAEFSAIRS